MNTASHPPVSRREQTLLGAIVMAPLVVFLVVRVFGYMRFLKLGLMGMGALAVGVVLLLRPRWGLWALVFYVYAGLGFYFPFNVAGLITVVVTAVVLLDLVMGGDNHITDPLFWYANGVFMLIAIGSMIFAQSPKIALVTLWSYVKMLALTLLTVQLVRTPAQLRTLMYVMFAGGIATVVLGVLNILLGIQSVADSYIHGSEYMLRFMSTHGNPNRAAAYMCTTLPMGIFAIRHARRWLKPVWIAGVLVMLVAIYSTYSRSVAFPLATIMLAVLVREVRRRRSYLMLAAVLAMGVVLTPHSYWERVLGLRQAFETTTQDWSVYVRLLALHTGWDLFLHHPLTGIGIGNFIVTSAYKLFYRLVTHNSYLEILVGTGVFGLLSFLFVMLSGFRHSLSGARTSWKRQPEWLRSACFYCALSSISIWMSSFFGTMPFRHPFWIPIAIGLVIRNLLNEERGDSAADLTPATP